MGNGNVFAVISLFLVLPGVNQKEVTKDFSCCKLPYKIPLDITNDNEFAIGNKTLAIAAGSTFAANPPFAIHRKTLTLEECKSFDQRIIFKNMINETEETIMHYLSQPCNTTAPEDQSQGHTSAGVIVGVVLGVVVVIGAIGIIVFLFMKTRNTGEANNVI